MSTKNKASVVLIDDNDVSRSMLRFIMASEESYDVVGEAGNGTLGLEMIEKFRPDIICLDIMMPDLSGIEVLKRVREQYPFAVVLMVTGSNDRDTVLAAVENGASGYIVKPFNPTTLLRTVEQALIKARALRAATGN